ncbi:transposase family protein [Streptomyces griseomycini]|uniref:transposase family protein n=1 Tax=Streptomyces griseomycini TaxID=66895 RepID=UPI003431535A
MVPSVDDSGPAVLVRARTRSCVPTACTGCGMLSGRCHSRYVRGLAHASSGDRPVLIELSARRLFCENTAGVKATFAERVPGLTAHSQRHAPAPAGGRSCGGWWRAGDAADPERRVLAVHRPLAADADTAACPS